MDRARIYDIIYALAAKGGREEALFGSCGPAAREAFARSLTGDAFPELWFEIPLAGKPWMDFHALVSYEDVAGARAAFAGHGGAYAEALAWFAAQGPDKVRQLALSYDTHVGNIEAPAVQLLVDGPDPAVPLAFLAAASRPDLRDAYSGFTRAMPSEWYACYTGVFPGRDAADADPWLRVECIVGDECQQAYAEDAAALREHLASVGMGEFDDSLVSGIQELARSSFPLEFQFNVGADGAALVLVAFRIGLGKTADWILPPIIALFALCTLIGWSHCGSTALESLGGKRFLTHYRVLFCAAAVIGAVSELEAVWMIADIANACMAYCNLPGILLLYPKFCKESV